MRKQLVHGYHHIISCENLLLAWKQFLKGKRNKIDVQEFQYHLGDNILSLHNDLKNKTYTHGGYYAFNISDPKPRNIHKASVRDRLLHHAIYRILYFFFDQTFITDSYSCRVRKGTHKALKRFEAFGYKSSKNHTKTVFITPSGFLVHEESPHLVQKHLEIIKQGTSILLLPSTDINEATNVVVSRQLARWNDTNHEREEKAFRRRFPLYSQYGDIQIFSKDSPEKIAERVIEELKKII